MTLAWPSSVSITLAGFRSRWTICLSCARARPAAISAATSSARATGRPAAGQPVAHLLAADQFHGDERVPVGFVHVVDDGDVRVLDRRGGLGFLHEPAAAIGVVDQILGQDLERDVAVETRVGGPVDDTHPAAADLLGDAVLGQRAAGQVHGGRGNTSTHARGGGKRAARSCRAAGVTCWRSRGWRRRLYEGSRRNRPRNASPARGQRRWPGTRRRRESIRPRIPWRPHRSRRSPGRR